MRNTSNIYLFYKLMISNLKGPGRYENEKQEKIYKVYSQNREVIKSTLINTNNNELTIFLENMKEAMKIFDAWLKKNK